MVYNGFYHINLLTLTNFLIQKDNFLIQKDKRYFLLPLSFFLHFTSSFEQNSDGLDIGLGLTTKKKQRQ